MHEMLLIAQLLAFHDDGIQDWVNSRTPEELCEMYTTGMIDDTMLPGGRGNGSMSGSQRRLALGPSLEPVKGRSWQKGDIVHGLDIHFIH